MNRTKKRLLLILCFIFVWASLSACSSENRKGENEGERGAETSESAAGDNDEKRYDDIVDIDWYVNLSWWKYGGEWGKDKFSRYIQDEFGLNINFITPAGDGADQISTMIASGSIPDMITVESWMDYKSKLAQGGYLAPMNELIELHAPDFKMYEDVFSWYEEGDGNTYVVPNFAYSSHAMKEGEQLEPNSSFTIRSDIYEQLGRPDISTADKFLDVLERVKNEIGTYDGKGIIPLQLYEFHSSGNTSEEWLREYFAVPYENADGDLTKRQEESKYWQVLKFLNEAYRRGLISPDNFTDKRDQINEKVASGRVFAKLTASQDFNPQMTTLFESDSKAKYEALALRNYDGDDPVLTDIRGWGWLVTGVSKKSKAQERIIKLMQFLYSKEGQHMTHFGGEGETYTWGEDGRVVMTEQYNELRDNNDGSLERKYGIGFNLLQDWYSVMNLYPKAEKPVDKYLADLKKPLVPYSHDTTAAGGKADPAHPERDTMREISNRIGLLWGKELPRIIMADSEEQARAVYEDYLAKIKEMGSDKLYAYANENFHRAKDALGIAYSWPPLVK
ncbi:extracellular solute-binding protein [Paenibacillus sp. J5C_2022]|uniref:extracellular solute-binding protein n=1 Tax=Paenibacillus sp. J5C2022 TaxID=2977129 RepID=UPI0021D3663E|nr:extracellular solute-binding protein [Paenibacillus sp. J5C2022]MCU6707724.1 extracellular solute-binding protein [Paenibacillus sp. J5C2022]